MWVLHFLILTILRSKINRRVVACFIVLLSGFTDLKGPVSDDDGEEG